MSSTFGGFNTVTRGLAAQQVALDTVAHNVANANTTGYSRQNVNLVTTNPQTTYSGNGSYQVGTGVDVVSITRARDTFVDKQLWKESSTLGYSQTMQDSLGKVEGVFQEPSDTGMQTVLNQFTTALQTLSTNASDSGARTTVQQRGIEVVNAVQHASQQLRDMATDINSSLDLNVTNINQITGAISALNNQITNIEAGGIDHANDLRDSRDVLVDQLSTLANITTTEDKAGNYNIQTSGVSLVSGNSSTKLATTSSTDPYYGYQVKNVVVAGSSQPVNFTSGEMKGLTDARDSSQTGVKGYLDKLDTMSKYLLQDFNAVHKAGYGTDVTAADGTTTDGSTNVNFFGTDGIDYESATSAPTPGTGGWIAKLQVNPVILASDGLAKIAAKTSIRDPITNKLQGDASGDNAVLLGNALTTKVSSTLGNASLENYYSSFIGGLGVQSQDAIRTTDNQTTLINQLSNLRESTAGVNTDEEMTNMIKFQKVYNAAARVLTTMDDMLDKLINTTGMVGR